jgi:hypothetical protein
MSRPRTVNSRIISVQMLEQPLANILGLSNVDPFIGQLQKSVNSTLTFIQMIDIRLSVRPMVVVLERHENLQEMQSGTNRMTLAGWYLVPTSHFPKRAISASIIVQRFCGLYEWDRLEKVLLSKHEITSTSWR